MLQSKGGSEHIIPTNESNEETKTPVQIEETVDSTEKLVLKVEEQLMKAINANK